MTLNKRKKKSMQTVLYGKTKETRREGLIGTNFQLQQHNTTQGKTKARRAPINKG